MGITQSNIKYGLRSLLLSAAICLILAGRTTAQTFTTLHNFAICATNSSGSLTNSEGAGPFGDLVLSGNTLYGTTLAGGVEDGGAVFAVNTDGSGFTNLHSFTALSGSAGLNAYGTNNEGVEPASGLILSGSTLYGTTYSGGTNGNGTVFAINTNGNSFRILYTFSAVNTNASGVYTNGDGAAPASGLLLSSNMLYGTAFAGGKNGNGTVFAVSTDGLVFTNLHNFTAMINSTNNDGAAPYDFGGLIVSGSTLYGTASAGGKRGNGSVFAINTNGTGFTNLYSFTLMSNGSNSDGAAPYAGLILTGSTLYGGTTSGGTNGGGTIFALSTNGTGLTTPHNFAAPIGSIGYFREGTNADGFSVDSLILLNGTLYGMAQLGGEADGGTVFAVETDGTGLSVLHSFTAADETTALGWGASWGYGNGPNYDGFFPGSGLVVSGSTFYGIAEDGGKNGTGTVFSILFAPELAIATSGTNVILTWPTNVAGFDYTGFNLQSNTNLITTNWSTVSPPPVVVNGQNTVTNPISGTQKFYRLSGVSATGIALAPASGSAGSMVAVSGQGFSPGENVNIYFGGVLVVIGTADSNGNFTGATFNVLNGTAGTVNITATGQSSGSSATAPFNRT